MFLETTLVTASIMVIAELADKTSLLTMSLASKTSKPFIVGTAALVGISSMTLVAVAISLILEQVIPVEVLQYIAVATFITIGIQGLLVNEENGKEEEKNNDTEDTRLFFSTVGLVALAEVGDKSQLFIIGQSLVQDPFAVFIGAVIGMGIVLYFSAFAGYKFLSRIPAERLEKISSAIFIGIGLMILFNLFFTY